VVPWKSSATLKIRACLYSIEQLVAQRLARHAADLFVPGNHTCGSGEQRSQFDANYTIVHPQETTSIEWVAVCVGNLPHNRLSEVNE
jgi:hypothetical protein